MVNRSFSIQNCPEKWFNIFIFLKSSYKVQNWFHKILIIVGLVVIIPFSNMSCKTCKCPAYSHIESQNTANMRDSTT